MSAGHTYQERLSHSWVGQCIADRHMKQMRANTKFTHSRVHTNSSTRTWTDQDSLSSVSVAESVASPEAAASLLLPVKGTWPSRV